MSKFLRDKDIKLDWVEQSKEEFYSNINDDLEYLYESNYFHDNKKKLFDLSFFY